MRTRVARRVAVAVLATLAALLMVEGAARVRQRVKYGTFGRIYEFEWDAASGLRLPVANLDTARIQTDSHGFRSPEPELPKPPGRVRIAFIGGSTVYCAEASSNEAAWPAQVVARLRERFPECSFDYVNAGAAGHTTRQMLVNLDARVLPLDPDLVVLHEATNDLARDTRDALSADVDLIERLEHGDRESWLTRFSLAAYLIEKNAMFHERRTSAELEGLGEGLDLESLAAGYGERFAQVLERASAGGSIPVACSFTRRVRPDQDASGRRTACASSLYYMPYMSPDRILEGFERYSTALRRAAERCGAILIECESAIPADETHFADSVHLTDRGCARMGEIVAEGLAADPRFRALCLSRAAVPGDSSGG